MISVDTKFMKEALRQARRGLGRTSPNPAVGAVIVRNGKVISGSYHKKAGCPHAEVEVLKKLGKNIQKDDILYVTLEPCNHYGKTPPCTKAILESGIRTVVIGTRDPNPGVQGGGCEFLRGKGVEVVTGVLEDECRQLNEVFFKYISSNRPFVIVKSALTLDGWSATVTGDSKWITNEESRQFVHRLRDRIDVVMVGVGTVLSDNPQLTTRLSHGRGRDPIRLIVDTELKTPLNANVINHSSLADTILVVGPNVSSQHIEKYQKKGVSVIVCPTKNGRIDLNALMDILGKMSLSSLLVEGGASIIGSIIRERLVDKFYIFKSPKILGGDDGIAMAEGTGPREMSRCISLSKIQTKRFADDILIVGYPTF
jgi:diaminohydroxyphosphoribosylaminopyrimidine deaminase/5-amino-6-(5-phosphoribosylamino)uracil reductase